MKRILVVDDSDAIRRSLRAWLERAGVWEVCGEARNGIEGVEQALHLHPDLIIMDTSMPAMNGFQASQSISRQMPNVPIVMFTAFASPQMESVAHASGVSVVRSKFEKTESLIDSIATLLASHEKGSSLSSRAREN